MRSVRPLKKGDTILLIAPSSPLRANVSAEAIADGLRAYGFNIVMGDSVHSETAKGYAAAPVDVRVNDIHRGFADPDIHAIWAVRGGSMAMELLPHLDYELIAANPKPLIGFSDVTALHMALQQKSGIVTYHAPCASIFGNPAGPDAYAVECFERAMTEEGFKFANPEGVDIVIVRPGDCEGVLFGGNLTLAASLVGTEYFADPDGKILFLEDVDEDVYRLDRMLQQLKLAGIFDRVSGVLLGDFTDSKNGYNADFGPDDLIREFFADYDKPVYAHLSVGHIRRNAALPMGRECVIRHGTILFR